MTLGLAWQDCKTKKKPILNLKNGKKYFCNQLQFVFLKVSQKMLTKTLLHVYPKGYQSLTLKNCNESMVQVQNSLIFERQNKWADIS